MSPFLTAVSSWREYLKKALAFGKGVGKTVVLPWRKAKRSKTECWKPWIFKEQILFATGEEDICDGCGLS
jgi:hypothetical protein